MPLRLGNCIIDDVDAEDFESSNFFKKFEDLNKSFDSSKLKKLPKNYLKIPTVYVMQHEYAIVSPANNFNPIIYTDDMTTCIAGILRHNSTGMICLIHFDHINFEQDLQTFEDICQKMCTNRRKFDSENEFELKLVGGYLDERKISQKLLIDILVLFNRIKYRIEIVYAKVGRCNTLYDDPNCDNNMGDKDDSSQKIARPRITSVCVHMNNSKLFVAPPFYLGDRCRIPMDAIPTVPLFKIRRAFVSFRSSLMRQYLSIYDYERQMITIPPLLFDKCYFKLSAKKYFEEALKFTDQDILNVNSTSPKVEPKHFVIEMRQIFQFFKEHLDKHGLDSGDIMTLQYFPKNQPRRFYAVENLNRKKTSQQQQQQQLVSNKDDSDSNDDDDGDDSYDEDFSEPYFLWKDY